MSRAMEALVITWMWPEAFPKMRIDLRGKCALVCGILQQAAPFQFFNEVVVRGEGHGGAVGAAEVATGGWDGCLEKNSHGTA
jgi:hypothetical protein